MLKNKHCQGCEHYTIYGARKCRCIKQKHYADFKTACPCRLCNHRDNCFKKSNYVILKEYPYTFKPKIKHLPTCPIFNQTLFDFIESIPDYFINTSYLYPYHNESYIVLKYNQKRMLNILKLDG